MSSFTGKEPLSVTDPELYAILEDERDRQRKGLELIASENFTSRAVMEALGSCFTNKYSEGLPGARYYGGNEHIDRMERLCQKRAVEAFHLSPDEWGVNVQPYSGSTANFAAYTALLQPHERMMGLDLPSGGHLTHGYYTSKKKISATSVYFESLPYHVDKKTGIIDYEELEKTAMMFLPKLIVCGGSAYPREWDYKRFREIADACGAKLLCDMAHISGLVASEVVDSPFEYCDVVTTTTHKSLRGPRAGLIFFRKVGRDGEKTDLEDRVNFAVFPALQGGPHMNAISAVCTQLREVATPEFKEYAIQVKKNAKAMADEMTKIGLTVASGGTDNHLVLWDLRPHGITGSKMEKLFEFCSITVNKNAIAGDKSAMIPGGIRLGSPALTTRGLQEEDFRQVAKFLQRGLEIGIKVQELSGKPLKAFVEECSKNEELTKLKADVEEFATKFHMPGLEN